MSTDEQYVPDDEDWVPTEEEVHHFSRAWLTASDFDRFLARVRRDAWDEGFQDGRRYEGEGDDGPHYTNPYSGQDADQ